MNERAQTAAEPSETDIPASLTKELFFLMKSIFFDCYNKLKGRNRRIFAAQLALALGKVGQLFISQQFKIGRTTLRKAIGEIKSGFPIIDKFKLAEIRRQLIEKKGYTDEELSTDQTLKH